MATGTIQKEIKNWTFQQTFSDTGTMNKALPSSFNELLISIESQNLNFNFTIIKDQLSSTPKTFVQGYFYASNDYMIVQVACSSTAIVSVSAKLVGTAKAATTSVYYR
jgi:hypothetical protein